MESSAGVGHSPSSDSPWEARHARPSAWQSLLCKVSMQRRTPAARTETAARAGVGDAKNAWSNETRSVGVNNSALSIITCSTTRSKRRSARTPSKMTKFTAVAKEEGDSKWPLQATHCARDSRRTSTSSWSGGPGTASSSSGNITLARACKVEEISCGLKAPRRTVHRGASLMTNSSIAECVGMILAQDQRMIARCCEPNSMVKATWRLLMNTSSFQKPSVAKPHSMLEISWALKSFILGVATCAMAASNRRSRCPMEANAQTVLPISWQLAACAVRRISAAMPDKSRCSFCRAVANAHTIIAKLRNEKLPTLPTMQVPAARKSAPTASETVSAAPALANPQSNIESSKGLKPCIFRVEREAMSPKSSTSPA
mmetsp:Transcript_4629/g.14891  ORF Transcript_4629/g.14891 Transcript_4629/m.14891 type:complete len:372 (-) Transcript_4629:506-1621(-)